MRCGSPLVVEPWMCSVLSSAYHHGHLISLGEQACVGQSQRRWCKQISSILSISSERFKAFSSPWSLSSNHRQRRALPYHLPTRRATYASRPARQGARYVKPSGHVSIASHKVRTKSRGDGRFPDLHPPPVPAAVLAALLCIYHPCPIPPSVTTSTSYTTQHRRSSLVQR